MAGRHPREWTRRTYTVSPEVAEAVAVHAAKMGMDPGTFIDTVIWNMFLKPDDQHLEQGGFSNVELERIFAEDALKEIAKRGGAGFLADCLFFVEGKVSALQQARRLVKRWNTTRRIDKERQEEILAALGDTWVPRILALGVVDPEWFYPD